MTRKIYVTVITANDLIVLGNKILVLISNNEDIIGVCSEVAIEVARTNGLSETDVLFCYRTELNGKASRYALPKVKTISVIDKVIEQIKTDISEGDLTALEELLKHIPIKNLEAYLPEKD
jgi:hypothetical protein